MNGHEERIKKCGKEIWDQMAPGTIQQAALSTEESWLLPEEAKKHGEHP